MGDFIVWYLVVGLIGMMVWPLAFTLLPGLPDRGYTLCRALGLLLAGYVFWLLTSLGFLQNTPGGIITAILIVFGISLWAIYGWPDSRDSKDFVAWLEGHVALVGISEVLFFVSFAGWALFRAYAPALNHTETPMELAFLNGISSSRVFPPIDPWLSGYSISYYYFGYVIIGMLAKLTGTPISIAFNIGIALLFGLTALGSYGIVYNLVSAAHKWTNSAFTSLLGPVFIGIMGNLEGMLEWLRAMNFSFITQSFWRWLDIEDLTEPLSRLLWPPDQWRFWWWWRASRVIRDRDIGGVAIGLQPIDEFPFFSFLLGDMHPHVLALPFVLLALALAFNVLTQTAKLSRYQLGIYAICFGGLAFLNTWDLPIYWFILIGALAIRHFDQPKSSRGDSLRWSAFFGLGTLVLGWIAYLPWYISFKSQLSLQMLVLPNVIFPTRFRQFFVMFGPFLVITSWFLVDRTIAMRRRLRWRWAVTMGGGLLVLLVSVMLLTGWLAVSLEPEAAAFLVSSTGVSVDGLTPDAVRELVPDAVRAALVNRLVNPVTAIFLMTLAILAVACLLPQAAVSQSGNPSDNTINRPQFEPSIAFALILILVGALLTLGPEFVYLGDVFRQRLNTVFKFYYAAWVLVGIASSYFLHDLLSRSKMPVRLALGSIAGVLIAGCLVYPTFAIPALAAPLIRSDKDQPVTLDGIDYIRRSYPGDYEGIVWLQQNAAPGSVVLEAVGGSYTYNGRVSGATGLPTLIGWPGHEQQWRGDLFGELAGAREIIVREIYTTPNIRRAQDLLNQFNVKYIFVGTLERNPTYSAPAGIQKFERFLAITFRSSNNDVVIYVTDEILSGDSR